MEPSTITLEPVRIPAADASGDKLERQMRERHRFMLWVAAFIIVAAFALRFGQGGALRLPGTNAALPMMCGSRIFFGVDCPGCGLTRSFVALAAGDLQESLRFNRVGWILALAVVVQIPYRLYMLREMRTRFVPRTWPTWFGYGIIATLLVNWLLKISGI